MHTNKLEDEDTYDLSLYIFIHHGDMKYWLNPLPDGASIDELYRLSSRLASVTNRESSTKPHTGTA
ncbi:MAG: hypothetical protein ACJ8BW_26425 [Ktedonobacteraceae bacterium]